MNGEESQRGGRSFPVGRAAEFVLMFVAAPIALSLVMRPGLLFPAIWALGALCLTTLLRDPTFDRNRLWRWEGVRGAVGPVAGVFAAGTAMLAGVLAVMEPESLLRLPRERPGLWLAIMLLYPVLSVYPQEVAFRAFFFHRYAGVFRSGRALVVVSALAFGLAHITMRNGWAMAFSTAGGFIFAWTYLRSRSLAAVCLEHSLYGCFLFTIGWGQYFYSGAMR